jgi:hypothetical protein
VQGIRAGGGAQIDMRTGCRALLRIIHRRIDPYFRYGLWRGRGDGVADGKID